MSNYSFFFIYEALYSFAGLKVMCDRISTIMRFPEKEEMDPHVRFVPNQLSVE